MSDVLAVADLRDPLLHSWEKVPAKPADEGAHPERPRSALPPHPPFGHPGSSPRQALLPQGEKADRARRLARDLVLYGLGSVAALAIDWLVLALLVRRGTPPLAAAATGFLLGMVVTYLASIRLVFADRRTGSRLREAAAFMVIGVAGLGLNELLIWGFCAHLGLAAPLAKAPTAAFVFLFNFAGRRALVFAAPAR